MGYVGLIRQLVNDVLTPGKLLSNIPITVTYYSGDAGGLATYDPATQIVSPNETVGTPVYAVFVDATARQIDNANVLRNDRFFYLSSMNLELAGIVVTRMKPNDRVVQDGISYTVVRADPDPTYSLWVIQGRTP